MNIQNIQGIKNSHNDTHLASGEFICPHCGEKGSIYSKDGYSSYQMNDIFEEVFCSYDCSKEFNLTHKAAILKEGYSEEDLEEMA